MEANTAEAIELDLTNKILDQIASLRATMKAFTEKSAFLNEEIVLDMPSGIPVVAEAETNPVVTNEHHSLITSFLQKKVGVIRITGEDDGENDLSSESTIKADNLVTEPLAKLYLAQKHYDKAIGVYEKLSLKFPEKSSYFASQIDKIVEVMGGFG